MIVSIHRYDLAESASEADFRDAVREAERRELFDLPGLVDYRFGRGIKGERRGGFAALWRYESREAWEDLWGPVDEQISKAKYPDAWNEWEDDLLAPVVSGDPDEVEYTTYELFAGDDR